MTKKKDGLSNVRSNELLACKPPSSFQYGRGFWSAYRRGWETPQDKLCPYKDIMVGLHNNVVSYSRSWRRFWFEGHEDKEKGVSRYAG